VDDSSRLVHYLQKEAIVYMHEIRFIFTDEKLLTAGLLKTHRMRQLQPSLSTSLPAAAIIVETRAEYLSD